MAVASLGSAIALGVLLLLPGGGIANFNVKQVVVTCLAVVIALRIAKGESVHQHWWIGVTGFGVFICWSLIVGLHNSNEQDAISTQLAAFLSAGSVFFLFSYLVRVGVLTRLEVIDVIVNLAVVLSMVKIILEVALIAGVIELESLFSFVKDAFGAAFIRLTVGWFYRINFPADLLLPGVLMALLFGLPSCGSKKGVFFVGIVLLGIFVSYSRYILLEAFIVLAYWYAAWAANRRSVLNWVVLLFSVVVSFFLGSMFFERFTGDAANSSDGARVEMAERLIAAALERPFGGHGIGYYVPDLIRVPDTPWYYELQWLSFFMQFGIAGVGFLLCLVLSLLVGVRRDRIGIGLGMTYLLWLGSGLVNGFFLTASSGVVFLFFWLLIYEYTQKSHRVLPSAVSSNS